MSSRLAACVKTPARFRTVLFCLLFRALRLLGSEKIAKDFALRDCLKKFAGFSHGLLGLQSAATPQSWVF